VRVMRNSELVLTYGEGCAALAEPASDAGEGTAQLRASINAFMRSRARVRQRDASCTACDSPRRYRLPLPRGDWAEASVFA
jgi:hypothetical protein